MAILKHIANKNNNYNTALEYLMFQHNEFTQKPLLDRQGNMILRDEFYLDGLNCDPYTFSRECDMLNAEFRKNCSDREIKSHHYIISFDPLDRTESGLTGRKAQTIGLEFANKFFSGHQALVCTHTDGHNGSGNIHVHIVLNSLRKYDVEPTDFTERPCDSRAGYKHHLTDKLLNHMQHTLMDICEREHLHQVDLLSPTSDRITDREYRKDLRENEKTSSPFQTQKEYIRNAVRDISSYASTPEEFGSELKTHYGISFKISRGRYSYLHPDRTKFITGRSLGDDYTERYLTAVFEGNRSAGRTRDDSMHQISDSNLDAGTVSTHTSETAPEYDPSYDYSRDPIAAFHFRTRLRLVVDLQSCAKAQSSRAYVRKVKLTNLQQMAQTICYVQEHHFDSLEELHKEIHSTEAVITKLSGSIDNTNKKLSEIAANKVNTYDHPYDRDQLLHMQKSLQLNRSSLRKYVKDLQIVSSNIDSMLREEPVLHSHRREKAQDL